MVSRLRGYKVIHNMNKIAHLRLFPPPPPDFSKFIMVTPIFAPQQNRGGVIFSLQFVCLSVCLSVCVSVCVSDVFL